MSVRAIDVAYNYLESTKTEISFQDLWNIVKKELNYSDALASKKISQFYTTLSLDGRFVNLENKNWALKSYCKYDDIAIVTENYDEDDDEDEENEDEFDNEENLDEESSTEADY